MKDLMIGTNSAVEGLEAGGVDEEGSSESEPSEGVMSVSKKVLPSSKSDDRVSKADRARPIMRHQCLFRSDEASAYLQEVSLISGNAMRIKWGCVPHWKVSVGLDMMRRWRREPLCESFTARRARRPVKLIYRG